MITYVIAYLVWFQFGYALADALGSWVEALVVLACLHILLHDCSQTRRRECGKE